MEDDREIGTGETLPEKIGELIEDAVRFINMTTKKMLAEYAIRIGNYLLARLFNDDIALATSSNHSKQVSFTKLCKRPDLALPRQTMGEMVRIAAQDRFFTSISIDISPIGYIKQAYLTRLPPSEAKMDLVMDCLNEEMSSRQLLHRIQEIKKGLPLTDETLQERIIGEYLGNMTRLLKKAAMPELFTAREKLYELSSDTRTRLKQTAVQWMADIEAKRAEYQALIDHLDYIATHPNT